MNNDCVWCKTTSVALRNKQHKSKRFQDFIEGRTEYNVCMCEGRLFDSAECVPVQVDMRLVETVLTHSLDICLCVVEVHNTTRVRCTLVGKCLCSTRM